MPDPVEVPAAAAPPPPEKSAVEIFNESIAAQPAAPAADGATPTAPAVPAAPEWDPKSVVIPKDATLPDHFKKYSGKTLADVIELDLQTQRYAGQQRTEADRLRVENEQLKSKQAAREELRDLLAPPVAPVDEWAAVGITPETPVWDQPRVALEATRALAGKDTTALIDKAKADIRAELNAEREAERRNTAVIQTFESAKAAIRAKGHAITDEEWSHDILPYIAPRLAQEETVSPGALYDPQKYVDHYERLRGAPAAPAKPVIPAEGAPPVSGRSASVTPQFTAPTASNEVTAMKQKVAGAMLAQGKWTKDEAAAYMGGS